MYALSIPIGLLSSVILARNLGPEAFGQYSFVLAVLSIIGLPVSGGLQQFLTREIADYSHTEQWSLYRGAINAAHIWVLLASVLVPIFYLIAGRLLGLMPVGGKWLLLEIVVLLLPIQGLNAVRNGVIKGLGFPALAEMPTMFIQSLILLVALAVLAFMELLTAKSAIWAQVYVGVFTFFIASIIFFKVRPKASLDHRGAYKIKTWLLALFPFTLISLIGTFSSQIGIVILGFFGTDEAVAAFRVAERGAQLVLISSTLVNMVISPHIVKTYREDNIQRLQELSRQSARGAFILAAILGIILIIMGESIIRYVFGSAYAGVAYSPMAILVCGYLFHLIAGSSGILLIMSGHEKLPLVCQLVGLSTMAVLAVFLIPSMHAIGAAVAVSVGLGITTLLQAYSVHKYLRIRPGIF